MGIALSMKLTRHTLVKEVIKEQGFELGILFVCSSDITKEDTLHTRQLIGL